MIINPYRFGGPAVFGLADDFESGYDTTTRWTTILSNTTTVGVVSGRLEIDVGAALSFNGAVTQSEFDFRGKYATGDIWGFRSNGSGNNLMTLIDATNGDNYATFFCQPGIGVFQCVYRNAGSDDTTSVGSIVPDKMRLRHDTGTNTLYWDTYETATSTWTQRKSITPVWNLQHSKIQFVAGGGSTAGPNPFRINALESDAIFT